MDILLFIQKYEDALKKKKISKSELYSRCGFSSSAVSQWKAGTAKPSMRTIENVSNFLDIPMSELLEEKEKSATLESAALHIETKYDLLSDSEKKFIAEMIEARLKVQSAD